jgi:hypothetical protein
MYVYTHTHTHTHRHTHMRTDLRELAGSLQHTLHYNQQCVCVRVCGNNSNYYRNNNDLYMYRKIENVLAHSDSAYTQVLLALTHLPLMCVV